MKLQLSRYIVLIFALAPALLGCPSARDLAQATTTTSPSKAAEALTSKAIEEKVELDGASSIQEYLSANQIDPLTFSQQEIVASEIGDAIREYDATFSRLPESAADLLENGLLWTTLTSPDGSPCPVGVEVAPWSYYLELSMGLRHWQLNRGVMSGSMRVVSEPVADAVNQMSASQRQFLAPAEAVRLLKDKPRPTAAASLRAYPADGIAYLAASNDLQDARVRAFEDTARTQLQEYLELHRELPVSWDELQSRLDISFIAGSSIVEQSNEALWEPLEAGIVILRSDTGEYFRIIQKPSAPAKVDSVFRVATPNSESQGVFTQSSLDQAEVDGIAWQTLLSISFST